MGGSTFFQNNNPQLSVLPFHTTKQGALHSCATLPALYLAETTLLILTS